ATVSPTAASTGSTPTFTLKYKPDPGGMENGDLQVAVPAGWTAPQTTTPGAPGYVTTDHGSISAAGQQISVSGLTLFGDIVKIQYRGTVGPALGAQTLTVSQRGSSGGTLTPLASPPQVTAYAA